MRRPNVLILHTDQQRWDTIRYGGNEHIHTPNLDALAASGALFQHCYCNSPICMPSRQSMFSGQYPSTIGTTCNGIEMPEDVLTIHQVLKPYGYHTASNGKLHFLNHANRDHREPHPDYGFDQLIVSDDFGCYEDAYLKWVELRDPSQVEACKSTSCPAWTGDMWTIPGREHSMVKPYVFPAPEELSHSTFVAEETIAYIERHQGEPFYAIAGFFGPHSPVNPPQRFLDLYDPMTLPLPHMNAGDDQLGLGDEGWRRVKAYYYALISHIDDQIGRILRALDELGLRENTLILFTSDHGDHMGDHGRVEKGTPRDSCNRIPLIASYPGRIPQGRIYEQLVEGVDLAPTILDYCGVQTPPVMQGRSLKPLFDGQGYEARTSAYMEVKVPAGHTEVRRRPERDRLSGWGTWKSLRTHDYAYVLYGDGQEQLFDIRQDPHELTDVAGSAAYKDALHEMRGEMLRRWFSVEPQYPKQTGVY
jgi:arylsulfatase A-like enzyme